MSITVALKKFWQHRSNRVISYGAILLFIPFFFLSSAFFSTFFLFLGVRRCIYLYEISCTYIKA